MEIGEEVQLAALAAEIFYFIRAVSRPATVETKLDPTNQELSTQRRLPHEEEPRFQSRSPAKKAPSHRSRTQEQQAWRSFNPPR
jgi:hypothetical protein